MRAFIEHMSRAVARAATMRLTLACWLGAALFFSLFSLVDPTAEALEREAEVRQGDFLDLRLHYTAQEARDTLDRYGADGRAKYRRFLALDFAFAACYGLALALTLTRVARSVFGPRTGWIKVNLIPLAAMLADFAENLCLFRMLNVFPDISILAGTVGGWITTSKQIFLAASFLTLILFGLIKLGNRWRRAF